MGEFRICSFTFVEFVAVCNKSHWRLRDYNVFFI